MAKVLPFKATRPAKDKVHLIASRSVDTYSQKELSEKLASNPYSFLHIINPDFSDGKHTPPGSMERLNKIKNRYNDFLKNNFLIEDTADCFYIYRQTKKEQSFTGIIACASIDDYFNGVIKVHEQTITEREEKLKHYLEVCDFNAEPVLFCYPNDAVIDELTKKATQQIPEYDFTTTDGSNHKLWLVNKKQELDIIEKRFASIPAIYIADGHHRSASSALLGKSRREKTKNYTGKESFNFYLGAFFPETELKIFDFNRVIKDLNGNSTESFIKALGKDFIIEKKGSQVYKPAKLHNFSLYIDSEWYSVTAKKEICNDKDPIAILDAAILSNAILAPILNITDLKTDLRIAFVPGIKGMEELKKIVDSGKAKAAFGLYPVTMEQLKIISDTNNIMPPKTTWVEPKLRSGLTIYSLT